MKFSTSWLYKLNVRNYTLDHFIYRCLLLSQLSSSSRPERRGGRLQGETRQRARRRRPRLMVLGRAPQQAPQRRPRRCSWRQRPPGGQRMRSSSSPFRNRNALRSREGGMRIDRPL
ncbi:hypothetical protein SAY86_005147 [Trapa natans]|uniref:Uncharacterized protein n=1 Tax=Trapa natans TaxID=22666 RepID=A0AAN7L2Y6_TRANT|nr:hypothetical protein SAY86_005147 [Trapa natans]